MKRWCGFSLFFGLVALVSCAGELAEPIPEPEVARSVAADENSAEEVVARAVVPQRKLIKKGSLAFETSDLVGTRSRIIGATKKLGGYVSREDSEGLETQNSETLVLRVPADSFDSLVEEVSSGVETFDEKEISSEDVTAQFIDIEARLKTKKALEQRYLALLEQAGNVTEILEIEKQAGELRTEIESIEARFKQLSEQIAMSTLTVRYYTEKKVVLGFFSKCKEGLDNGWRGFLFFVIGLINIWPLLLIAGVIFGVVKWRIAVRRRKNPESMKKK